MMPESIQQIAVLTPSAAESRIFLAAIVATSKTMITYQDKNITVSIRDYGKELLFGAERIQEELKASSHANAFDLHKALKFPQQIPDTLELSVQTDEQFIGRLRFFCASELYSADAVIALVSETGKFSDQLFPFLDKSRSNVCFAVKCSKPPDTDVQQYLNDLIPDLHSQTVGRLWACHWYHPNGFSSDGSQKAPENAVPLGIQEIFWSSARLAASFRLASLRKKASENYDIIRRRNSWFQKNSIRRRLELNQARNAYAETVLSMYGSEQFLALSEGRPLAEDSALKGVTKS